MLIVWGTKHYGRTEEVEGQFAVTRFGHVWFLPFIPLGTLWVTSHHGRELSGHGRRWSWRSLLAGYLRPWGTLYAAVGVISLAIGEGTTMLAIGGVLGGLALATLGWRTQRKPRELRRGRFNMLTLGTACDPLAMPRDFASHLHGQAKQRWAKAAGTLTPEDVAVRGSTSAPQAAAAYVLLRMTARLEKGEVARRARSASEEILDRTGALELTGSPYRDELPAAPVPPDDAGPPAP
jgi:hypothetical protein